MNKYIFTFKREHPLRDHYQPVFAPTSKLARLKMYQRYGPGMWNQHDVKHEDSISKRFSELAPVYMKGGDLIESK